MIPHSCILGFIMFKSYAVVWNSKVAVTLLTWNVALHKRHVPCFERTKCAWFSVLGIVLSGSSLHGVGINAGNANALIISYYEGIFCYN